MRTARIGARVALAALLALVTLGAATVSAKPAAKVLLDDLSSPKGIAVAPDAALIIGQGTFGPPGPILRYELLGSGKGETTPLTQPENVTDVASAPDGSGWAIGGDAVLYHASPDGTVEAVLNIPEYQETDVDPVDQDDFPEESNPYGLTAMPNGDALLTDAANNDLLRVTPSGDTTTVARFDLEVVSTDHLPPDFPFPVPPELTAEAVPTSVTIGPDGAAYVSELKGFPFRPGTSHVWRVDPDEEGAFCSVRTPEPECTVYASGFTGIQDIAFNANNGRLYVYELAEDGVLAFEAGFESGEFPPAVLLKVKKHTRVELVPGVLSEPGGIAITHDGTVYVTDGVFSSGRLLRIRG